MACPARTDRRRKTCALTKRVLRFKQMQAQTELSRSTLRPRCFLSKAKCNRAPSYSAKENPRVFLSFNYFRVYQRAHASRRI